jgi:copper transport protein
MTVRSQSAALVAALAALALFAPSSASAHAQLASSEPDSGSAIAKPPRTIRLEFSEEISERFRRVTVLGRRGHPVPGTQVASGPGDKSLTVRLPVLPRGPYEVVWEVLAEDDGHVTSGAVAFGVGVKAPKVAHAPVSGGEPPGATEPSLRWLDFSLLACLLGGIAVALLLAGIGLRGGSPAALLLVARRRVARAAAVAGALGAALGAVLFIRQAHALPDGGSLSDSAGRLFGTRWGALWLAREALLAGMVVLALALRGARDADRRALTRFGLPAAAGALALASVRALGGHAAAVASHDGLAVTSDAVHVLAAAIWIGGVFALVLALFPSGGDRAETVALARALRAPFSVMAGTCVALLAVTGLYAAGAQVASVSALVSTLYGQTLLVKVGLVLAAGLLGLINGRLLRRVMTPPRARLLITLELVIGLEVIGAAAILASSSPPRGPAFSPPPAAPVPTLVQRRGDLLVSARLEPNRRGTNAVSVAAASSLRPPPAPVDRVALKLANATGGAPQRVSLTPVGPGRFTGTVWLPRDGRWKMAVAVRRGGNLTTSHFGWSVAPASPSGPLRVSGRPLAPIVDRVALAGLLLLGFVGAWFATRSWRRAGRAFTERALRA